MPLELIAQHPVEPRDASRLLVCDRATQTHRHRHFYDLPEFLRPGDLLVANDMSVINARLQGRKPTGGRVQVLLLRKLDDLTWEALVGGRAGAVRQERAGSLCDGRADEHNAELESAAANAQRYTVCVGTLPGLCDVMNHVQVLSPTTSVGLTGTQAGRTYWWQVWAYNDGQFLLANAGQWWPFTTANNAGFGPSGGPAEFTKVAPVDTAQVGSLVTLQWNDTNASEYRVCVGTGWGLCDVVNNVRLNPSGMVINSVNVVLSYQTGIWRRGHTGGR